MTDNYFNTGGTWIAFSIDAKNVWSPKGKWIGWRAFADDDIITPRGRYLGTTRGNRLVHFHGHPYRGYPGYPGYPGYAGYSGYVPGARDLEPGDYDEGTYDE